MIDMDVQQIIEVVLPIAKSILLAIIVLIVGLFIIKRLSKILKRRIQKSNIDKTLKSFITSIIINLLRIVLIVSIVNILGIDTTSIVALLASAGLAIGLAFQGALSNFAGGVLILFSRPFRVGDYISTSSHSGTVEAIKILYTEIKTMENDVIYVPNGSLANAPITNYSVMDKKKIVLEVSAGYDYSASKVKGVLKKVVDKHPLVLKEEDPYIKMVGHGDNSIQYTLRCWTKAEDFWGVKRDLLEQIKEEFDKEKISIPFPQMDIHIKKED